MDYYQSSLQVAAKISYFLDFVKYPRTPLEVHLALKDIRATIHPHMEVKRVWERLYILSSKNKSFFEDQSRRKGPFKGYQPAKIHSSNKKWIIEYIKLLSFGKETL